MAFSYDIAVVGGGASGLAAAVSASLEFEKNNRQAKIVVLESNARVGKKLLATGNGRCNLTNRNVNLVHYHGDTECLLDILEKFSSQTVTEFFELLGLLCKEQDEGRVYPYSMQASTVLDILRIQLDHYHVEQNCGSPVTAVQKVPSGFVLTAGDQEVQAKRVIFASGGMAYPQLGANGSGYSILKSLGHSCTELFPTLVQLKTEPKRAKPLKGARSTASATLLVNGKPVQTVTGEVQFTENGLSGICIFELSRMVGGYSNEARLEVSLDMMPEYTVEQIISRLKHRCEGTPDLPVNELLCGCLNKLVAQEITKLSLAGTVKYVKELSFTQLKNVAEKAKHFCFPITGTLSWRDAQVTAGGIRLSEFDETMQSKVCPGLYACGEILNIDGDCGGFNLHWAWSTGILSGRWAARSFMKEKR